MRPHIAPRLLALALLAGCVSAAHQEGLELYDAGRYEEGVARLEEAVRAEPGNPRYRIAWLKRREEASNTLLRAAETERGAGRVEEAEKLYARVIALGAQAARAQAALDAMRREHRHRDLVQQAQGALKKGEREAALVALRSVLLENPSQREAINLVRQIEEEKQKEGIAAPTLRSRLTKPVTVQFREAPLRQVLEGLTRSTGINFIFDREVKPDLRTTIYATNVPVEDAIDLILLPSQLEKKVLSENTVLIYPATPNKLREYQDLILKTFYLSNADVKQTQNLIRTMLKTKDVFIDEKLNLLIMRDTPEAIRLAEKLIAAQDLAEPEVVIEVAVMEVSRSKLTEIGIRWPDQVSFGVVDRTSASPLMLDDLKRLTRGDISVSPSPGVTINAKATNGDSNLLANPRIRVRNREKARILVGDRLPVISAIVTPSTSQPITTESVQYLDVGLKVEVEANVHLDDEVALKVNLEVSNASNRRTTQNGTTVYDIGTRTASTILRAKDGETQVLMGLIRDDDRKSAAGVAGLSDLPILGRLFSNNLDDRQKTEIILSFTPRVVRNITRADVSASEFWSGTEVALRTQPLALRSTRPAPGEARATEPAGNAEAPAAAAAKPAPQAAAAPALQAQETGPAADVRFSWSGPAAARVGEPIDLVLRARIDQPLTGTALQIGYDAKAFEVVAVSEGDLVKSAPSRVAFNHRVDAAAGKIFVSIVSGGGGGLSGEGPLLTLQLKPLAAAPLAAVQLAVASPVGAGGRPLVPATGARHAVAVGGAR